MAAKNKPTRSNNNTSSKDTQGAVSSSPQRRKEPIAPTPKEKSEEE